MKERNVTLCEIQNEMLRLLNLVSMICQKHEISYWIDSGTLLGAIRHEGFIPWDDDLDICVMKSDYDKLMGLLATEITQSERAFLLYPPGSTSFWCNYLCSADYYLSTARGHEQACRIDIFPMKCLKKEKEEEDRYLSDIANFYIRGKRLYSHTLPNFYKNHTFEQALEKKRKFLNEYMGCYMNKNGEPFPEGLITHSHGVSYHGKEKEYFLYSDIFPIQNSKFHGYFFNIPNNSHSYLEKLYGDYKKLPKKKDRKPAFDFFLFKKGINIENSPIQKKEKESFFYIKKSPLYKLKITYFFIKKNGILRTLRKILKNE